MPNVLVSPRQSHPSLKDLAMLSRFSKLNLRSKASSSKSSKNRQRKRPAFSGLAFQKLEDRKMLASVNFNAGTGALVVVGNAIADTISLTNSEDHQSFTVDINNNASLQQTFNYSDVTSVKVLAGDGDDFIYNTLLMDTEVYGQNGNDHLEGGWANDLVMGGNGIDILVGRNGDDVLNGQDGNDWLFGGPGVDNLSGITGNDNLYGGTGNDTLNGHGGNDSLWGEAGDDALLGGAGDDLLRGQDGDDTISGGGGDDWLVGADGDDALNGDAGDDELLGQNGNDILNGGADDDLLYAGDGDDTLRGDSGSDHLYGHGGDDLLDAGSDQAADVLTGGKGLDEFVVAGSIGSGSADAVTDRAGFETYNGYDGPLTALAEIDGDQLIVRGMPGNDNIQIFNIEGQDFFKVTSEGQSLGIHSTSSISAIVIDGGDGDDLIENNNRSIIAMEVNGGAGEDWIYGGFGNDMLIGGSGDDTIKGRDGEDELFGGDGDDDLFGGDDDDELNGDAGNDLLYGESDDDTLRGGFGDDKLHGGSSNDQLFGGAGADELFGGAHNDALFAGTDIVEDVLWGNGGIDSFDYVEGIDEIRDQGGNESSSAAVAQSIEELSSLASEVMSGIFSRDELTSFANSGSETIVDGLNVVTIGTKRFVFEQVSDGFEMLGDFSVSLPVSTASSILAARDQTSNGPYGASLGPDFTVSLVPSSVLQSDAASSLSGLSSAFVASGNGVDVVVGGASSNSDDQIVPQFFSTSNIVTNLATSTLENLADRRLDVSQGGGLIASISGLQGGDNPIVGVAVSGLINGSLLAFQGVAAPSNETVNLEINYHFTTLTASAAMKADVNRIFQDLMTKNARNDQKVTHTLNITWVTHATKQKLDAVALGFSGGNFFGVNPTKITVAIHDGLRLPGIPGQAGVGTFRAGLNPGPINAAAAADPLVTVPTAIATVVAHELGLHAIGGKHFHFHNNGFVDAENGLVNGTFSKEARVLIADQMGVDY